MIQHESTRRWRISRAIERGDPRLGFFVGAAVFLAVALAFASRYGPARRLDDAVMDQFFNRRPPIPESDRILMVNMNDDTHRQLGSITRKEHAQVLLALDRLGAKEVVFDVEFKMSASRPGDYDEATGEYLLNEADRFLLFALKTSGKAVLAYHFDLDDPLKPEVRAGFPKMLDVLRKDFAASSGELARAAEVSAKSVEDEANAVRVEAAHALVGELLGRNSRATFPEIREALLPRYNPLLHAGDLKVLHYAYWVARGTMALEGKRSVPRTEGVPAQAVRARAIIPPLYPFLEHALGAGPANAVSDADGVMRRPWAATWFEGKPYLYLGLEGALRSIGASDVRIGPQAVTLAWEGREVLLPMDEEGRILINWAGNREHKRGTGKDYFRHLPYHEFCSYYEERYRHLDKNVRQRISKIEEETGEPYHREYLPWSDRRNEILAGRLAASAAEFRELEAKIDGACRAMMAEFEAELREAEKGLTTVKGDRALKRLQEHIVRMRDRLDGIRPFFDREAVLRRQVEGRLCWIGSASTASGDLHPTPLGAATPGVDVLANAANMVLTNQALFTAAGWVNFFYLIAVGFAVTWAVTHWSTGWSMLFTVGVMGFSLVVFGAFFIGRSLLLSGAGPLFTSILTFAAVTAFKELVTQRSKKKLQRELEKNTSAELVKILMEHPEFLAKPRKMVGTFFFSDVKSFTSISEKMAPEILVPYISRYLDRQTQELKKHLAFLDKYIGDGIMALFGIPVPSPHHARNACLAALDCQAVLKGLNQEFEREGLPQIKTRIGIHSGDVIAGYVGATDRSDYTVLGDNVNLASRLEGANKEYGSSIMISEATYDMVSSQFVVRELDRIRVVGKQNAVRIFELLGPVGGSLPFDAKFLGEYESALQAFKDRRWPEAIEGFERAQALKPGDKPSELYHVRASAFQLSPPPPDWEGVFELTSK